MVGFNQNADFHPTTPIAEDLDIYPDERLMPDVRARKTQHYAQYTCPRQFMTEVRPQPQPAGPGKKFSCFAHLGIRVLTDHDRFAWLPEQ